MQRATGGMDVQARLKPLKPFPWLKMVLSAWEPQDRPKYYQIACGRTMDDAAWLQPCPQSLREVEPAGIRRGRVNLATKLRALDGLPPAKPWDWIVEYDGRFDRDETGTYVLVHKRPKPVRPGWRRSENPYYRVGRRPLPERVKRALQGTGSEYHLDSDYQIVGHIVILPAVIVCPRCGARNHAHPPFALAPHAPPHAPEGDSSQSLT